MYKVILLFFIPLSSLASRLDPVIVSSRTNTQSSNITSSHEVIDSKKVDNENLSVAIETLKNSPGVYVAQNGGPGGQASIFIRGSEVRHVLVLIDGIKVNDPSNPNKTFNAANLSTLDIEKIEIIKGAQSVLYGADAIGGVINIITKKGQPRQTINTELGFQNQIGGSLNIVKDNSVTYFNGYYAESEGISTNKDGDERDGYTKQGFTLNHSHSFETLDVKWMVKILQDNVEDDRFDNSNNFLDDPEAYSRSLQQVYNQTITKNIGEGELKYSLSLNKMDREVNYFNTTNTRYEQLIFEGSTILQDINFLRTDGITETIVGLSHEYESFAQTGIERSKVNLYSVYLAFNHQMQQNFMNFGLRNDHHEAFGDILTYNLGLGRKFSNRRQLKFNYSTGFKAPSLYQLYGVFNGNFQIGNKDLEPEKSRTMDLSFKKMGKNSYEVTLFNSYIYNFFFIPTGGVYTNKGSFNSQGIEASAKQKVKKASFTQGFTLSQFDLSGDDNVLRRPEEKVDLDFEYELSDSLSFRYHWRWVASRFDKRGSTEYILPAYDLSNISLSYKKNAHDYHLGINNVFDREYEDVFGYGVMGFTLFAKANFNY